MKNDKDYYIAKSISSKLFIANDGSIIKDWSKAAYFTTVGDCMKACIEANDNLGKAAFQICYVGIKQNNKK
jgi:hypothetical protein